MSGEISIDWDVGRDIIVTALYDPGHTLLSPRLEIVGPNPSVTLPVLYTNSSQDGLLAASIPVAMVP